MTIDNGHMISFPSLDVGFFLRYGVGLAVV